MLKNITDKAYWILCLAPLLSLVIGFGNPWPSEGANLGLAITLSIVAIVLVRGHANMAKGKVPLILISFGVLLLFVYLSLWSLYVVKDTALYDGVEGFTANVIGYARLVEDPTLSDLDLMNYVNWEPGLGWTAFSLLVIRLSLVLSYSAAFGCLSAGIALFQIGRQADESIREIAIFLASSEELRSDRDMFDLYFRQQNDRLRSEGIYLRIVRWENFLDVVSNKRKQDEYNSAVQDSNIAIFLFKGRMGQFTVEEFDVAHRAFIDTGRPLILTYFNNDSSSANEQSQELQDQSITEFQNRLSGLGHYYSFYENIEHLKRQFRDQFDMLKDSGRL